MSKKHVNTEEAQGYYDRATMRLYWQLERSTAVLTDQMEDWSLSGMKITKMTIRGPELTGGGFMAIINAVGEDGRKVVAFRTAGSVADLMRKVGSDIETDQLNYKEDKPWKPDGAGAGA